MLNISARFSAVIPMASVPYISCNFLFTKRHPKLESSILESLPNAIADFEITKGPLDMCSIPPAINTSPSPALIARFACTTADIPDEHNLLIVSPGTVYGNPAKSSAIRATFLLSSPAWLWHPSITSSIASLGRFGYFSSKALMGIAAKSSALTCAKAPLKLPIGVLIASTIYASFIFLL